MESPDIPEDTRPFMDPEEEKALREKIAKNGWNIVFPPGRIRLGFPPVPESLRDPALWEGFDEWLAEQRGWNKPVENKEKAL